jgi:hypothetical protein
MLYIIRMTETTVNQGLAESNAGISYPNFLESLLFSKGFTYYATA